MEKKIETVYFPVSSFLRDGYLDGVTLGMSFDQIKSLWGENSLFSPPRQPRILQTNFGGIGMIFEKVSLVLISMDVDFELFSYQNYDRAKLKTLDIEFLRHNLPEIEAEKFFLSLNLDYRKQSRLPDSKDRKTVYSFASGVELVFLNDDCNDGLRFLEFHAPNISYYLNSIPKYCGY